MRITPYYESKGVKNPYYVLSPSVVNGVVRELKKQGDEYKNIKKDVDQFIKDINLECIPIIKEYANLNFGALSSNKKQDVKSVKEQELKKIIEKYG